VSSLLRSPPSSANETGGLLLGAYPVGGVQLVLAGNALLSVSLGSKGGLLVGSFVSSLLPPLPPSADEMRLLLGAYPVGGTQLVLPDSASLSVSFDSKGVLLAISSV